MLGTGVAQILILLGCLGFLDLLAAGASGAQRAGRRGREKDGLWAVLAWLSILAYRNVPHEDLGSKLAKLAPGARRPAPPAPGAGARVPGKKMPAKAAKAGL